MYEDDMDRRKHPDYSSITAYLPKEKIRQLKATAALRDCTLSEAVEAAIDAWMKASANGKEVQP